MDGASLVGDDGEICSQTHARQDGRQTHIKTIGIDVPAISREDKRQVQTKYRTIMTGKERQLAGMRSAFPSQTEINGEMYINAGLSKREIFAAMAMQGLCAYSGAPSIHSNPGDEAQIAKVALLCADALTERLNNN